MIAWKMIALASARPWQADHEESCRCFPWRPHARAIPNGLGDICHGSGTPRANLFQGQLYCCLAKAWAVPGHRWNHLKHLWTTWQPVHVANVIWIWQTSGDNLFLVILAWKPGLRHSDLWDFIGAYHGGLQCAGAKGCLRICGVELEMQLFQRGESTRFFLSHDQMKPKQVKPRVYSVQ